MIDVGKQHMGVAWRSQAPRTNAINSKKMQPSLKPALKVEK